MPLATTLRSIVDANTSGQPIEFHLLVDGISEGTRSKIFDSLPKGSASIRWVDVDLEEFHGFSTLSYISKVTYARLLIPDIFPETVSRILYLDCDILVLNDLQELCEADLEGNVVGAVVDGLDTNLKNNTVPTAVPRVRDYFNCGVLLIDLDKWRANHISSRALEYLNLNPESPFSDQDALNVACDGIGKSWTSVGTTWLTMRR